VLTTEFGQEKAITLLSPERQQLAEYDITEMIHSATSRTKKKIGILAPANLAVSTYPAETVRSMGLVIDAGQKGRSILEQLKAHYDVTTLPPDGASFQKLDAVVVIHPRNLSEQTIAALDRHVVEGGKLAVFQDPAFMADPLAGNAGSAYAPGRALRTSTGSLPPGAARCRQICLPQTRGLPFRRRPPGMQQTQDRQP